MRATYELCKYRARALFALYARQEGRRGAFENKTVASAFARFVGRSRQTMHSLSLSLSRFVGFAIESGTAV